MFHISAHALMAAALTFASSVVNASLTAACVVASNIGRLVKGSTAVANDCTQDISSLKDPNNGLDALIASTEASHSNETVSPSLSGFVRYVFLSVILSGDNDSS
jgi:hypothetical protein